MTSSAVAGGCAKRVSAFLMTFMSAVTEITMSRTVVLSANVETECDINHDPI